MGIQNVQKLEGSYTVLLYFILYTVICTHTEFLNDIDNTVVISYPCLMLHPYERKISMKKTGTLCFLISPTSSYYDLMKTLSVSGKCFNAVSLAVPST